ncbi:tetratricopeptide repeat protein [Brevibacillus ruminantium]|uniref:Tetratricopeptide repeat protein n=1 Tax=Brevibacillus ruminantium TaxID=2950604 RepID=A0ABY4WFH8_9BACL|nr:tetratricopeptide repeat protein [Brevibacillus ruminantium]USG65915.1 tetratricopeptide repeat protein [Brevibacillus ruminantium]
MGKVMLFSILWWITGNPFVALLIILIVLYALDLRFVRLLPDVTKPFRRNSRIAALRRELRLNPHDTSAKVELARLLMEKGQYQEALAYLDEVALIMQESAEVISDRGICLLKTGRVEEGEAILKKALEMNPRVKYGEPYLRLGEAFAKHNQTEKALAYLEELTGIQTSSAEVYYKLGMLYTQIGQKEKARQAFSEAVEVYRGLPKYKKRTERRWALLSWMKSKG